MMYPLVQSLCSEPPSTAVTDYSQRELPAGNPRQTSDSEGIQVGQPLQSIPEEVSEDLSDDVSLMVYDQRDPELVSAGKEALKYFTCDIDSEKQVGLDEEDTIETHFLVFSDAAFKTEQRNIDALKYDNPESYKATPMELMWSALRHTERFSNPTGKVDTELRQSMVAMHHVGNPGGSSARFMLMTHEEYDYYISGKDGRTWEACYHGTSIPASFEIIAKSKMGAQAFRVTDDHQQAILCEML